MAVYLFRRTAFLVVSLLLAMVVLFFLLRVLPGDPANALPSASATPEQIAAARQQVGSDLPLVQQFATWFGSLLTFDLGESFITSLPIGPEIASRLVVTVQLTLLSFALAVGLALPIGFFAAWKADRWYGLALSAFSQLGIAVPVFWVGILLVGVFSIALRWFPSGGFPRDDWADPVAALGSLALPIATIAIVMSASISWYVRSATLDVIGSDYLRNARALGSGFGRAMWRHGLRNGAAPVVSVLGIELATAFLGAVVVESVFALPGLGSMLLRAIEQHDSPGIQGILFVSTLLVLVVGFLADITQRLIDPRLRHSISGDR
ncbi:ABC transporter permease [Leifsonia xyli subsp. xyli]|uniref:ABC transporter, permease protein n=2 Tax=Leifsonia xyli subsp. xyli TaxID=59736 RepID=Q6AD98_LEIXX|nr:ABC transporter permease [Leifsonia xyli]AAT89646.1 ABC transporter, permease protein [Leifsonia xyli subsp. xyli str. CTCB07]ODA91244.1 ABC transporter permease [Leifsonia xyli subsp. xyli]